MSPHSINHQIKQQAKHWLARLDRGLSDDEKPQLIAWINQNPAHHKAIYQNAGFFNDLAELKELNGIFPIEKSNNLFSWLQNKASLAILAMLSLLMAAFAGAAIKYWPSSAVDTNNSQVYLTQVGEFEQVILPDGSKLTLNTDTKVSVTYTEHYRNINLLYGEAQFDVAKDKQRPFTVNVGAKSFTALGTIFNIQKNNELDMELIVTEGQVLVSESHFDNQVLKQVINEEVAKFDSPFIITSGEKSTIENRIQKPTLSLSNQQTDRELSWQHGMLVFNGQSLNQALMEVSRYTDVQFEIPDVEIGEIKISGYYKAGDVDGLLKSLAYNFDIDYKFNTSHSVQLHHKNNS